MSLTVVIGGTRSGKSRRAEVLARAAADGRQVRYVVTADGGDLSMRARIEEHAARRPPDWSVFEPRERLTEALGDGGQAGCVLIDALGPWLARVLERAGAFADPPASDGAAARAREAVLADVDELAAAAARPNRSIVVVAEEAGLGLLPPTAGARAWLDLLGEVTQRLSATADRVELVVGGRPLPLPAASAASGLGALRRHGDSEVRPGDADHAVNVLAGGPPPWLREALERALATSASAYPDEREAVVALAALHGRDPDEVVPTNGAAEALWLLGPAFRPRLAACVHPGFTEGDAALRAHGVPVTRVIRDPERDFAVDPAAVPADADLVLVGNPASPSGTLAPAAALLALRRPGRVLVVDEAFMDLVPGEPASLVRERLDDVVVVRSLTKALAIPGLRAGYAVAAPALAECMRAVRPPWSANALALAALAVAAARSEALAAAAERAERERADLERGLASVPRIRSWPASANFCLVEVPDGPAVTCALRERGIAVRPAGSFPGLGPNHLRITARDQEANARLAAALAEAVAACP